MQSEQPLFQHEHYQDLLTNYLYKLPKKGRGELQKISKILNMHSTRVSRIFNGKSCPTLEQAAQIAGYFRFSELETDFFMALVGEARSGNSSLTQYYRKQIGEIRKKAQLLSNNIISDKVLAESEQAIFYSDWIYSAIRLATSIKKFQTVAALAEKFKIPKDKVRRVIDFLVENGLCGEENGKIVMGPSKTHLPSDSVMISHFHRNWRFKAIEHYPNLSNRDLSFSAPMSITLSDFNFIREQLVSALTLIANRAANTNEPETLACLGIDFFQM